MRRQNDPVIVVGVDGSGCSVEALRLAARLAPALSARIRAILCWDYPIFYSGFTPMGLDAYEKSAGISLQSALEEAFGPELPANLSSEVRQGPPAAILVEESFDARMLVLGSRGLGGFRGLLLGSVSSICASHAHCPVLVVHDDDMAQPDLTEPATAADLRSEP